MQEGALYLLGEHDFSAYRAAACQAQTPVRRVERLEVVRRDRLIAFEVTANAFLHHMVRNIVGVLIAIGAGRHPPDWAREVLDGRDRRLAGVTAVPQGLYLTAVEYPPGFGLPPVPAGAWL
jgi:tRNA pseudouridine38-40 synthase